MHAMLGDVYKYRQTMSITQQSVNQSIWVASKIGNTVTVIWVVKSWCRHPLFL